LTPVSPRVSASFAATGDCAAAGEKVCCRAFFLGNPLVGNADLQPKSAGFDGGITQVLWEKRPLSVTYFILNLPISSILTKTFHLLVNWSCSRSSPRRRDGNVGSWSTLNFLAQLTYLHADIKARLRNCVTGCSGVVASIRWRPLAMLDVLLKALFVGEVLDSSIPTGM
jgi:hypothetical protein